MRLRVIRLHARRCFHRAHLDRCDASKPDMLLQVTINSLHDVFDSAKGIMSWLAQAARAIASGHLKDPGSGNIKDKSKADVVHWTTPLGLPAMQHYRTGVSSSPSLCLGD